LLIGVSAAHGWQADDRTRGGITGSVIDATSGEAIPKASVTLHRQPTDPAGAYTNSEGKFALLDLEPGEYTITAQRTGYVPAKNDRLTATIIAGATESAPTIGMLRTGAISGRVIDADGEPVVGANVQLLPTRRSRNQGGPVASTDDRGRYRVFHIPPGDFYIAATYGGHMMQLSGMRMQDSVETGQEAYAMTYFPGIIDVSQAAAVTLRPGSDLAGYDIQLRRVRAVWIRGRVIGQGDASVPGMVVVALSPARPAGGGQFRHVVVRDPQGAFEVTHVLPGTYRLVANTTIGNERREGSRVVVVADSDVEGIELVLAPPVKITGRIQVAEGREIPKGLLVGLVRREAGSHEISSMVNVGADGAFSLSDITAGDYDAFLAASQTSGDEQYVAAIRMGDADVLTDGMEVSGTDLPPLEIVLKPNGGVLECEVKNEKGDPLASAHVALLPDPPRERQLALLGDCRTRADGKCKIGGITPGAYHAFAFEKEQEIDLGDPEVLKALEKYGQAVKFDEGDRRTIELDPIQEEL
jgi:hypothetical protein